MGSPIFATLAGKKRAVPSATTITLIHRYYLTPLWYFGNFEISSNEKRPPIRSESRIICFSVEGVIHDRRILNSRRNIKVSIETKFQSDSRRNFRTTSAGYLNISLSQDQHGQTSNSPALRENRLLLVQRYLSCTWDTRELNPRSEESGGFSSGF